MRHQRGRRHPHVKTISIVPLRSTVSSINTTSDELCGVAQEHEAQYYRVMLTMCELVPEWMKKGMGGTLQRISAVEPAITEPNVGDAR